MSETARLAMAGTSDRYRITVEQYHRMGETGILPDDARVELLDGEIVEMTPIGSRHAAAVRRLNQAFSALWDQAVLSVQDPVGLPPTSEPEPDFMLLRPHPDHYSTRHPGPGDVLLLIEVSESSLPKDRVRKGPIYARHGIAEYWILDLANDRIEVRRRPEGDDWTETRIVRRGEEIAPAAFPDFRLAVDSILPPPAE